MKKIIDFADTKGNRFENGGLLIGRFDDANKTTIVEKFLSAPDGFGKQAVAFEFTHELWDIFFKTAR